MIYFSAIATRDFEYMSKFPRLKDASALLDKRISIEDTFSSLSTRRGAPYDRYDTTYLTLQQSIILQNDAVREFLRKHLHRRLSWGPEERRKNRVAYNQGHPRSLYFLFLDRLSRFIVAVGGGCAFIVPMFLISFDASRTESLVTVSTVVVLFALAMNLEFQTDNKDSLAATATYAVVLVMFIETSGAGS